MCIATAGAAYVTASESTVGESPTATRKSAVLRFRKSRASAIVALMTERGSSLPFTSSRFNSCVVLVSESETSDQQRAGITLIASAISCRVRATGEAVGFPFLSPALGKTTAGLGRVVGLKNAHQCCASSAPRHHGARDRAGRTLGCGCDGRSLAWTEMAGCISQPALIAGQCVRACLHWRCTAQPTNCRTRSAAARLPISASSSRESCIK